MCSSLSEKSIYFSLTASILLDALALPCDTLTINKTNGGQYPGDKMERKEIDEKTLYINVETGSTDDYNGWWYTNENGEDVNAVDLGEVVEVKES